MRPWGGGAGRGAGCVGWAGRALAQKPLTAGFIGKFFIIATGVQSQLWWLLGVMVIGSGIAVFYYLRVMVTLYLREPGMQLRDARADWAFSSGGLVVLLSAILVVLLGIYPQPVISLVQGFQHVVLR